MHPHPVKEPNLTRKFRSIPEFRKQRAVSSGADLPTPVLGPAHLPPASGPGQRPHGSTLDKQRSGVKRRAVLAVTRQCGTADELGRPASRPARGQGSAAGLQQFGHPPGRNDRRAIGMHVAPGDTSAMHGHDGRDLEVGDAEDLVGLVGRPPDLTQGGDEQVAAVPEHPVRVQPQPPPVLLGVDDKDTTRADRQVDAPIAFKRRSGGPGGLGSWL
jgi:hypothetical protein